MKVVKKIMMYIAIFLAAQLLVIGINILQNGPFEWDGRQMDEILGINAENASADDIDKLSKADVMQLFFAAGMPEFTKMNGEYKARMVQAGILSKANEFYAHNLMGPGHWEAKAFFPIAKDRGQGYNLFIVDENGNPAPVRTLKMDTFAGKSNFDNKESFHLVYEAYNTDQNRSMRDEIRKINNRLYLGLGYLTWNLGTCNPSPFVLYGEPGKWVGPDEEVQKAGK